MFHLCELELVQHDTQVKVEGLRLTLTTLQHSTHLSRRLEIFWHFFQLKFHAIVAEHFVRSFNFTFCSARIKISDCITRDRD